MVPWEIFIDPPRVRFWIISRLNTYRILLGWYVNGNRSSTLTKGCESVDIRSGCVDWNGEMWWRIFIQFKRCMMMMSSSFSGRRWCILSGWITSIDSIKELPWNCLFHYLFNHFINYSINLRNWRAALVTDENMPISRLTVEYWLSWRKQEHDERPLNEDACALRHKHVQVKRQEYDNWTDDVQREGPGEDHEMMSVKVIFICGRRKRGQKEQQLMTNIILSLNDKNRISFPTIPSSFYRESSPGQVARFIVLQKRWKLPRWSVLILINPFWER